MDEAQVRKIAQLAKLEFTEEELPRLTAELERILGYVERLQAADLSALPPEGEAGAEAAPGPRPDVAAASFTPAEATENAPAAEEGAFLVPRVIG